MNILRSTMYITFAAAALGFGRAGRGAEADENRTADELVQAALRAAIRGAAERQELLQAALAKSPGHAAARWHAGFVRVDNRWIHVEQYAERNVDRQKLLAYGRVREQVLADEGLPPAERHRKLAEWCRQRGLPARRRAHLTRLLEETPDDVDARTQLGHVNVNGAWLQPEEIAAARGRAVRAARAMLMWRPRLQRLGVLLRTGGDGPPWKRELIRQKAIEQWEAIHDPEAIPAMEVVFSTRPIPPALRQHSRRSGASRSPARSAPLKEAPIPPSTRYVPGPYMVIDKLGEISGPEAAVSLARHAVFCTLPEVRGAAVGKLKSRPVEHYVPMMLAALRTPMQVRAEVYRTPDGRFLHRQMYYCEGQQHRELAVLDRVFTFGTGDRAIATRRALGTMAGEQQRINAIARQDRVPEGPLNILICEVLAAVTGEEFESTPENWWQWWYDYNEIYVEGEKPLVRVNRREEVVVDGYRPRPRPVQPAMSFGRFGGTLSKECLAAGTLVWTDRGPVPIEEIRVGDMVLSQEPDTGELAFKPVVRTTSRMPEKMVEFTTDSETLETSGGHRFWVSGTGWNRARDFQPGVRLYGLLENHGVRTVRVVDPKTTYNLIVADFHTYFVGQARILSHDNTIPRATGALVPGLAASGHCRRKSHTVSAAERAWGKQLPRPAGRD